MTETWIQSISQTEITMALPTFFIIGAPKAGTTSLHYYLSHHPEIQMSAIKEPRFFAGPENASPYPRDRIATLDEYEQLFDPAFSVRGESSTGLCSPPKTHRSARPDQSIGAEGKVFVYG